MRLRLAAFLLLASAALGTPAFADQVSDQIGKALTAYQNHDLQAALTALDAAASQLRQQRADELKALLPPPPAEWTADPAQTSAVSAAMLGGGTTASRTYHSGDEQVEVQLTTDSPMLQQMAALASGPLGEASGSRVETVAGQRASYSASENGLITLVGTAIVKVDGSKQVPEAMLRTFMGAIDFSALQNLAH